MLAANLSKAAIAAALLHINVADACEALPVSAPTIADRLTFDLRFARSLAALVVDPVPDATAWAYQVDDGRDATETKNDALLFILDDNSCVIASGHVGASLWDRALSATGSLPQARFGYPWVHIPGDIDLSKA